MTRYYEDPTGITKIVHYEVAEEDAQAQRRAYAGRVSEEVDSILDAAVGSGRISMDDRADWEPKLYADPDWGRRTIELLPTNERLAEKAFHEDRRLRSLDHQWLGHLGVETRPVEYESDDLTEEARTARDFLAVLGK